MNSKQMNVLVVIVLTSLLFIVFDCLKGKAGTLEPTAPPQPTMVTLDQLSAQIATISSPVEKVVRGVITFEKKSPAEVTHDFSPPVDPNRCVVLLGNAVAFDRESNPSSYQEWIARTGACLIDLTQTQITVQIESHPAFQKIGYQIIEYK